MATAVDYSSSSTDDTSWIGDFCALKGNEFFCRVSDDFILDQFNATGLRERVLLYEKATDRILSCNLNNISNESQNIRSDDAIIERYARQLYGLWHARYVLSSQGLDDIREKYEMGTYGVCPRWRCNNARMLPLAITDIQEKSGVKLYCPACCEVFEPNRSHHQTIDGAYFGTGLPHMFFMAYPNLRPQPSPLPFL